MSGDKKKKKGYKKNGKLEKEFYESELSRLQVELVKLQQWVRHKGLKVVVLFEGRDAAGKGGVIKRITDKLNPRYCTVVAKGKPTEREEMQWYFQRYTSHLPAEGEIVLFDRSWYNCPVVDRVMGFVTEDEVKEFFIAAPQFEKMLIRSGTVLVKYWFSVSDEEQERRFKDRMDDPTKRWKISQVDVESRKKWVEYSKAKDEMFEKTSYPECPWYVVEADDKKKARLNCISHLLKQIPYEDLTPDKIKLPVRQDYGDYVRPAYSEQNFIPHIY